MLLTKLSELSRHGRAQLYPPDTAYPGSQTPVRFRRARTSTLALPVRLLGRFPWRRRPPGPRPLCPCPQPYPGFTGTGTDTRLNGWSPWRPADSWLLFATARTRASTMVLPARIRSWLSSRTEEKRVQLPLSQTTNITLYCTPYCTLDPWTCLPTFLPV